MSTSGVARNDGSQKTMFIRKRVQVTDSGLSAGYKIGRLPSRAHITQISLHIAVVFNSVTTDTLQLGTTATGTDVLAATNVHTGATVGYANQTSAAGLGLTVTGSGEVDVYAQWVETGGGATTGDVTVVIEYVPDNDH